MTAATQAPERAARPADADGDAAARQVEELLDRLEAAGGPDSRATGDELVRALMRFYGAGLARIIELLGAQNGGAALGPLLADSRAAALLTLHDLHPEDLRTRVGRALASVPGRPFDLAGLDEAAPSVTLVRQASTGCGCGNSADDDREAVAAALACFAPEVDDVEVRTAAPEAPLLQIGTRPAAVSGAR